MRAPALVAGAALVSLGCVDVSTVSWKRGEGECSGTPPHTWKTGSPEEAGLDGAALEALAARIEAGELPDIHSLLVVRHGHLVFERYFTGNDATWGRPLGEVTFDASVLHDQRSVTKSVVGALVGIAHGEGAIPDIDAPVVSFLPDRREHNAALAGITIRHALTMSAGLSWDEVSHPYWDPRNDETGMWLRDDPVGYVLDRDVVAEPGAVFAYNGGLPTVLAAVVEHATGTSIAEFAQKQLWCPLGVAEVEWLRHGSGSYIAASGLRLRPRDMARFGWMMLNDGRFEGRQIVPAEYARASLETQVLTGGSLYDNYGYQWWVEPMAGQGRREFPLPLAVGNGGQRILVDRLAGLVVVVTAGRYDQPDQAEAPWVALESVRGAVRGPGAAADQTVRSSDRAANSAPLTPTSPNTSALSAPNSGARPRALPSAPENFSGFP